MNTTTNTVETNGQQAAQAAAEMSSIFQEAYAKNGDIFVKVAAKSYTGFVKSVAAASPVRRTKRFNPKNTADRALFKFVRQDLKLKGKHVHIHVITPTVKEDTFRDEKGHLVKLTDEFKRIEQ